MDVRHDGGQIIKKQGKLKVDQIGSLPQCSMKQRSIHNKALRRIRVEEQI
jgi:hypothetical protein